MLNKSEHPEQAEAKTEEDQPPSIATTGNIASHLAPIPTERDLAIVGGVFALTSAKRDKLGELRNALGEGDLTLDDKATDEELMDLYLADGLKLITKCTDAALDLSGTKDEMKLLSDFSAWLDSQHDPSEDDELSRTAMEIKLELISAKLDNLLGEVPADTCLRHVRDFLDPETIPEELGEAGEDENLLCSLGGAESDALDVGSPFFRNAVARYRLLLTKATVDKVSASWDVLTTVSDGDIDRAASEGIALVPELETVSISGVLGFLQKTATGSCSERITAAWNLMDRDRDGSLDEAEMNHVVHLCLGIETDALQVLFREAVDAFPVRAPLSAIGAGNEKDGGDGDVDNAGAVGRQGWKARRREKKTRKTLAKMFERACQRHFDRELEIDHRLRCVYAWANKADQGNQLKSVLVDEQAGWSGRKRYVELSPKISEAEFREVQEIHFRHLDKLGTELVTSFREDLWVLQGKGRERKDLVKNSFLFLGAVSAIDTAILLL